MDRGKRKDMCVIDDYAGDTNSYLEGYDYGYNKGYSSGESGGFTDGSTFGELLGKYKQAEYTLNELNSLVNYYEQPQDKFEMGFRQGLYRAKIWAEEEFKKRKEEINEKLD